MTFKISILGSTRGSNLFALYQLLEHTDIKIIDIISNQLHSGILEKAKLLNLSFCYFPSNHFEEKLNEQLEKNKIDLLVLMGFMKILSPKFVSCWRNKIINVHPSLLPKYAGLMDLSVHQSVLNAKEKESGCSVHYVIETVDSGDVIIQKKCNVFESDTVETLKIRVQKLEVHALFEAIIKISENKK
ncbi:MAG: phosphoribosylglycinamide formyltransferase [uncultured bacterium]|nr:MAG: phosphoribosylglycinamide formyltransferase [uncultured bacterium]